MNPIVILLALIILILIGCARALVHTYHRGVKDGEAVGWRKARHQVNEARQPDASESPLPSVQSPHAYH